MPPRGDASSGDENADPSFAVLREGARLRRKKSVEKAAGQRLSRERTLEREKRLSSRSRERSVTSTSVTSTVTSVQVSRSFRHDAPPGMLPPIPPARSNSSRRAAAAPTTSTPSKKRPTPYQLWREQRLVSEMRQVSPVPPMVAPAMAFQQETQPQRFKKRQRSPSGVSNASSTTAEPQRKVVPAAEVAETVSLGSNDSEKSSSSKAKRSLSSLFGKGSKKKEQLRKTSTTASLLHGALTLNPDFHKAIVEYNNGSPASSKHADRQANQQQVSVRVSPPPPAHVMGTVLRPQLPRGRTPFQEWRHFRQQQKQKELQQQEEQQQQPPRSDLAIEVTAPYRSTPSPRLTRTPEPDYDTTSVGSAVSYASSYRSSKEDLRPRQARRP